MRVLVPFSLDRPKSRLSDVLGPTERESFAGAMLTDVLEAVEEAGGTPVVLATEPIDSPIADGRPVRVDDRELTVAVNDALDEYRDNSVGERDAIAVVMSDLPLATPRSLRRLFGADGDVVIAAGRGGGTNALVVREPAFRVDYHGASYLDHLRFAADVGATVTEIDSRRLATDVDEPDDLAELLVHGDGRAATWLRDAGFDLDTSGGRVGVGRE